jgi:hypothetical protein
MASESRYNAMLKIGGELQALYERRTAEQQEANDAVAAERLALQQEQAELEMMKAQQAQRSKDIKGRAQYEQREMLERAERSRAQTITAAKRTYEAAKQEIRDAEEKFAEQVKRGKAQNEENYASATSDAETHYAEEKKRAESWVATADERERKANDEFVLAVTKKQNEMKRRELAVSSQQKNVDDRVSTIDKQIEIAREIMGSLKEISVAAPESTRK